MIKRKASPLVFGRALASPGLQPLRNKITELSTQGLTMPLYADTIFGVQADPDNAFFSGLKKWFLLFDLYRVFLYGDRMEPDGPRVRSVVRFIVDDYPFEQFDLLADYFKAHPFRFFYGLESLDVLPRYWSSEIAGKVMVLDMTTAEVRISDAQVHPQEQTISVVYGATSNRAASSAAKKELVLSDRLAGSGWRADRISSLDGFTSSDVGVVRRELELVSEASIPHAVTRVGWGRGPKELFCGGASFRAGEAIFVARCEAIERHHIVFRPTDAPMEYGSYAELHEKAVDPLSLFFRMPKSKGEWPRVAYTPSLPMYWTPARNLVTGDNRLVPAQEVWFSTGRLAGENICIACTTNASALGGCIEEAALFAILEAIERDAFLTTWYLRRACRKVIPESVEFEPFQLLWARMRATFPNYSIHLFDVSTDIEIPAVSAIAIKERGKGPRSLVTGSARPGAERALFTALKDLSVQLNRNSKLYERALHERLLGSPEQVVTPEDHRALYSLDEACERLSFIGLQLPPQVEVNDLNKRCIIKPGASYNLRNVVESILNHLSQLGLDVFLIDISQPAFASRNLRCIKAITPGLFPMWFGHNHARFSLTDRLQRLALRFTGRTLKDESEVNLDVHPFS